MDDFVYLRGEGRGGGFVVIVTVIGGLFGNFNKGKIDSVAGLCSKRVKVKVGEEATVGTEGDGVGICTAAAPKDSFAVVSEVQVVVPPVDKGVDGGQPWFAQDEIVV